MKRFWENLLFSRISPALWLITALLGIFFVSGTPEQKTDVSQPVYTIPVQQPPLNSAPTEQRERGALQSAIPGTLPPVVVSRRGNEPVALRLLRSGAAGICNLESWLLVQIFQSGSQKQDYYFSFQSFLQHSLPPRAGPQAV